MHTADQAKELWCPMIRIARRETEQPSGGGRIDVVGGCNSDALGKTRVPASCRCIADKCGMWRWASAHEGYCGLAGRQDEVV